MLFDDEIVARLIIALCDHVVQPSFSLSEI